MVADVEPLIGRHVQINGHVYVAHAAEGQHDRAGVGTRVAQDGLAEGCRYRFGIAV